MENTIQNNNIKSNIPFNNKEKKSKREIAARIGVYATIFIAVAFILVPLYIVFITSFTGNSESKLAGFRWWPQDGITIEAYRTAFTRKTAKGTLLKSFVTTMWVYLPSIAVGTFMSAMAAYAFAKLDFVLKKPMFAILMASITLPNCVGLISSVLIYNEINWLGTALPLMVPRMMGSVGCMFFLRQFYMGIPDDLFGAGSIDGLNEVGLFTKIALPLSLPALGSQFILSFISAYNDFLAPFLYLMGSDIEVLQIALASFVGMYEQEWNVRMAGTFIAIGPLLLLYLISQRFILKGVSITSGLKG